MSWLWKKLTQVYEWGKIRQKLLLKLSSYLVLASIIGFYGWQIYANGFKFDWHAYHFSLMHIFAVLAMHAISLFYGGLGWAAIMRLMGERNNLYKSIKVYYLTLVTRNLPNPILHSASRVYLHQEEGRGKTLTLVAILIELLITVMAGAIIYLVVTYLGQDEPIVPTLYAWAIFGLGFGFLYPSVFKRLMRWVPGYLGQAEIAPRFSLKKVLYLLFLYAIIIFFAGVMFFYTINAVYYVPIATLGSVIAAFAISMAVMGLTFWLPGSLRIRDATLLLSLSTLTTPDVALIVTFLWRYVILFSDFFWGVVAFGVIWWRDDTLWQDYLGKILKISSNRLNWSLFKYKSKPAETSE